MYEKTPAPGNDPLHAASWSQKCAVEYYCSHRTSIGDVYDSENFFLSRILRQGYSVLDIGCAAGGFYNIFREYEPTLSYTGVDISQDMIHQARSLHPDAEFRVADGSDLPFADNSFDIVFSAGAFHMAPNWREILAEGWRVARNYLLFDIRLKESPPSIENIEISYEKIAFTGHWDGKTIVPYIIIDMPAFLRIIDALTPKPASLQVHGYFHMVSEMTVSSEKEVCMTMCCLGKHHNTQDTNLWDVPIKKPGTG